MRKLRQAMVFAALFILLMGIGALMGTRAGDSVAQHFLREAIFKDWAKLNQILYFVVAFASFWVVFPFLFWCRRGIADWPKRIKKFVWVTIGATITSAFVAVMGALALSLVNVVTSGDFLFKHHCIHLSVIPLAILIVFLCVLIIKPLAGLIKY